MPRRIFVDSNVLFSRTLRDWLFLLRNEAGGLFQVHSSIDVVVEVVRAVRRRKPELPGVVTSALHDALLANLDDIQLDFDVRVDFVGSDPHDRHVHAAAIAARADVLLTGNGRDFGDLDRLPYELLTLDAFFLAVDDAVPEVVRRVVVQQAHYWATRSIPAAELPRALERAGCPEFAQRVRGHLRIECDPDRIAHRH